MHNLKIGFVDLQGKKNECIKNLKVGSVFINNYFFKYHLQDW